MSKQFLNSILCSTLLPVLVSLIALAVNISVASAETDTSCTQSGEHESTTYLLIDRTDQLENIDNLKQSLNIVKQMIKPGERLIVGASAGKASETRVLMDYVQPKQSLWVSKLKIRAEEKRFSDCFLKIEQSVEVQDESHKTSALLETLDVVSKALQSDSSPKKRVIIFSDMIQNSPVLSFYTQSVVDPASALKSAEKEFLIAPFSQVEFHVAGVGVGVSDKKARSIEHFWRKYFEKAGGTLKFYGPVLFAS